MSKLSDSLTNAQAEAAGGADLRIFVEAGPGSGKTVVASALFGAQRFGRVVGRDQRAVVAASFTRSATAELGARITRDWGPAAARIPHRVCTLDALINEFARYLLTSKEVAWPGGHTELEVVDDWKTVAAGEYGLTDVRISLRAGVVVPESFALSERKSCLTLAQFRGAIGQGICSHNDVRQLIALFLADPGGREVLKRWFGTQYRALIVDEVFDANPLDVDLLQIAADAGLNVAMIGDPWQALYGFRGAVPDQVLSFIRSYEFKVRPLTESFRFRTDSQNRLAERLRRGLGVDLTIGVPAACDVVLAHKWQELWDVSESVLPVAFTQRSSSGWAVVTLALHAVLMYFHGTSALHLNEALRITGVEGEEQREFLMSRLVGIVACFKEDREDRAVAAAWGCVADAIKKVNPEFTAGNRKLKELKEIRRRLRLDRRPTLGLTVHQAKGREWDHVGVVLSRNITSRLAGGLNPQDELDRVAYVALTRARDMTVLISDQEAFAVTQ